MSGMPAMSCITMTRTVKFKVRPEANAGKISALLATVQGWDRAVGFYTDFFLEHPGIFSEQKSYVVWRGKHAGEERRRPLTNQEILTWAERHTVVTRAHPDPSRDFGQVCPEAPTVLRRAAINHAAGAVRSYRSNLANREAANPKQRGKTPALPQPHPHLVTYDGLSSLRLENYRKGFLRLRLFNGKRWNWHNVPVQGPPYAPELFAQSQAERARIAAEREAQNARLRAEGRTERTKEEREALRPTVGVWVAQFPVLIPKKDGWWVHVPFEKRVLIRGKAEDRRLAEPDLRVGTFDLNAASTVGAAWQGKRCIGIKTIRHARENEKREQALRTVAKKQRRSGRAVKGERSNRSLWNYVHNLDDALAWQIAARLVTWAVTLGLQVLVFEHLRPYRPVRGLSWSRRTNRKRSYWLRGKVVKYARHLALIHGILVVERNPAWTSRACPKCHRLAERFSPGGAGYPSRLACGHCLAPGLAGLRHGDANVAAALNLKPKWDRTFRYPTQEEVKAAAEPRRAGNGGAASRANDKMADALPA
ncbi:MAG: hypothetical protein M0031_02790 [Thermaerobacter sp.]|nr:hypothetical protein [Thermaerobacter sp.]